MAAAPAPADNTALIVVVAILAIMVWMPRTSQAAAPDSRVDQDRTRGRDRAEEARQRARKEQNATAGFLSDLFAAGAQLVQNIRNGGEGGFTGYDAATGQNVLDGMVY